MFAEKVFHFQSKAVATEIFITTSVLRELIELRPSEMYQVKKSVVMSSAQFESLHMKIHSVKLWGSRTMVEM